MPISAGNIPSDVFVFGDSDGFASQLEALETWKDALKRKLISTDDTGDEYLRKYVPSATPCAFATPSGNEFVDYKPVQGGQVDGHASFIAGLNTLVSPFPAEKRVSFINCHTKVQPFPYSAFMGQHHASHPSVAVSFPGQMLDAQTTRLGWSNFSMVIELNAKTADDPLHGSEYGKTLVQLAVDGRNLLHAHRFLASFVIGVYGDIFRIYRFDHSGAVFSKALSLRNVDGLRVLQQFFWRFANPTEGSSVVGCDPTVRGLTSDDEQWLKNRLDLVGVNVEDLVLSEARRAEILDGNDLATHNPPPAYMLLKALDVNARLFSRATTVWLGIRDTRRVVNGRLIDPPIDHIPPEDLKMRIIKDTWRPLVRRPETDFYTRLSRIPADERIGFPTLVCGGDLGEHEVRRWESRLYGTPTSRRLANHQARLSSSPTAADSSSTSIPPPSLLAMSTDPHLPPHRPLQQTFTWRQARGPESWQRERSHMRFVVDKVGRPLNQFRNTREMTVAIRDAIRGHRVAMSRAGILHRDISVNNILIVDDPDDQAFFGGFIHDFDCSSMSRKAPASALACSSSAGLTELFVGGDCGDELKERRGTFYFMAVMLLSNGHKVHGVHHDLESFYWVLLWVVLRHTDHDHPDGQNACPNIFKLGWGWEAVLGPKLLWLASGARMKFGIKNSLPLTTLLKDFRDLCFRKAFGNCVDPLNYDQVLAIFDKALDSDEYKGRWPEDDSPLEYDLLDPRIKDGERRSRKRKRKAKHARVPDPDSETDMDDEGIDFEPFDDIDQEDGPAPVMPPYYDEGAVELIVPSDYARFLEAGPSPAPYVRSTGAAPCDEVSESFGEACEVEDMLEFDESDDSLDDADQLQGPDGSSVRKARKRRRTAAASNASAMLAGTSGCPGAL